MSKIEGRREEDLLLWKKLHPFRLISMLFAIMALIVLIIKWQSTEQIAFIPYVQLLMGLMFFFSSLNDFRQRHLGLGWLNMFVAVVCGYASLSVLLR